MARCDSGQPSPEALPSPDGVPSTRSSVVAGHPSALVPRSEPLVTYAVSSTGSTGSTGSMYSTGSGCTCIGGGGTGVVGQVGSSASDSGTAWGWYTAPVCVTGWVGSGS